MNRIIKIGMDVHSTNYTLCAMEPTIGSEERIFGEGQIAQCLCYGGYHPVYIPTGEDDAVKEYLRMRDDHKLALKKLKQQINAFVL